MYYMKLKDNNEAFSRNFISPPFIWGITAVYLGLVLLANTIARYNAPIYSYRSRTHLACTSGNFKYYCRSILCCTYCILFLGYKYGNIKKSSKETTWKDLFLSVSTYVPDTYY